MPDNKKLTFESMPQGQPKPDRAFKDFIRVFERGGVGFWHWDLSTDTVYCHHSYKHLIEREDENLPDAPWLPCIFSYDLDPAKAKLIEFVSKGKENPEIQFRVIHRKSGLRWHLCRGKVTSKTSDGQIRGMTFMNIDITGQRLAMDRLKERDRQLQTVFKIIPGAIYRTTVKERRANVFLSPSSQAEEVMGFSDVDAFQYHLRVKIHPDDRPEVYRQLDKALKKRQLFELVFRIASFGEDWKWVLDRGVGVYDKNGQVIAIDGFMMDISQQNAREMEIRKENMILKSVIQNQNLFCDIVGKSNAMQDVFRLIYQSAGKNANVIIYGESGTGKELVARAIHKISDRKNKPFVAVNCGAIAATLMESEFFGHAKGAFTGASEDNKGFLNQADGGTLFLDELGEISLDMQVKLLRVLEGHGYRPVGGDKVHKPDVRIIAATNRNLEKLVAEKRIRKDFYYRVHVLPINLPPLRDRKEDIPLLVEHILHEYPEDKRMLPSSLMASLVQYAWPGNVRELQNVVHRFVTFGERDINVRNPSGPEKTPPEARLAVGESLGAQLARFERTIIEESLKHNRWHRGQVAKELAINPKTLYRKLKTYRTQKP
jgi:transcriptional regulator with PAS, ATPase and Fis domain